MDSQEEAAMRKIYSTINEKNKKILENQAYTQGYTVASKELKGKIEQTREEISKISDQIETMKPEIEELSSCFDGQVEALDINLQSLINQRLYLRSEKQRFTEMENKQNHIVQEYLKNYNERKEKLENSSSLFKELQAKEIELKKCEFFSLDYKQKIINLKKIHKQKLEIKKRLFYNDIVSFAKAWLMQKEELKWMVELQEAKKLEREALQELQEAQELVKKKNRRSTLMFDTEQLTEDDHQKSRETDENSTKKKILDILNKPQETDASKYFLPKTITNSTPTPNYNSDKSKVKILDVQTIKPQPNANKHTPLKVHKTGLSIIEKFERKISQRTISRQNSLCNPFLKPSCITTTSLQNKNGKNNGLVDTNIRRNSQCTKPLLRHSQLDQMETSRSNLDFQDSQNKKMLSELCDYQTKTSEANTENKSISLSSQKSLINISQNLETLPNEMNTGKVDFPNSLSTGATNELQKLKLSSQSSTMDIVISQSQQSQPKGTSSKKISVNTEDKQENNDNKKNVSTCEFDSKITTELPNLTNISRIAKNSPQFGAKQEGNNILLTKGKVFEEFPSQVDFQENSKENHLKTGKDKKEKEIYTSFNWFNSEFQNTFNPFAVQNFENVGANIDKGGNNISYQFGKVDDASVISYDNDYDMSFKSPLSNLDIEYQNSNGAPMNFGNDADFEMPFKNPEFDLTNMNHITNNDGSSKGPKFCFGPFGI